MQRRIWPIWVYYGIAVFAFLADYASKKFISRTVELNTEKISVLGNFFEITHIRNRGAAFGMLQEQRLFFILITIVVVSGLPWHLSRSYRSAGSILLLSGLATILGGALGNFLDRALYGEVVDFLQFNFGSYTFPIFNIADTAITVGVGLIILDALLTMKQEKNANGNGEQTKDESAGQQSV